MSKRRNGPSAREHAGADDRRSRGESRTAAYNAPVASANRMPAPHYGQSEYARTVQLQQDVARADGDYQRLRSAFLEQVRRDPTHAVALAMIGADVDRAHARLQALLGASGLPLTHQPSAVLLRDALRADDNR